jgi:hypothetical protein
MKRQLQAFVVAFNSALYNIMQRNPMNLLITAQLKVVFLFTVWISSSIKNKIFRADKNPKRTATAYLKKTNQ